MIKLEFKLGICDSSSRTQSFRSGAEPDQRVAGNLVDGFSRRDLWIIGMKAPRVWRSV